MQQINENKFKTVKKERHIKVEICKPTIMKYRPKHEIQSDDKAYSMALVDFTNQVLTAYFFGNFNTLTD